MSVETYPAAYLINEAKSLHTRLHMVKPFTMTMPMVRGASISPNALKAVTELLEAGKENLHIELLKFIQLAGSAEGNMQLDAMQKKFTILRLRFNSILDQLDIYADVLSQRAEHDVGIWLAGLDALAENGLSIGKEYFDSPPLMVFLERGHGAAIRRARTRVPGGDENPVAVIQIPRERMIGSSIASSLLHEVGHQAAELMGLINSLRSAIAARKQLAKNKIPYTFFDRWISEIIADYWAIGQLGIGSALGLTGVVTLPSYFQFRLDLDDPHPAPYVRVQISCAFGDSLYPHPQWRKLWNLWKAFYPTEKLPEEKQKLLHDLESELPNFIELVNNHKPKALHGKRLADLFPLKERRPEILQQQFSQLISDQQAFRKLSPVQAFAITGQAKSDLRLDAIQESKLLLSALRQWAFKRN